jgi:hypothetical protein
MSTPKPLVWSKIAGVSLPGVVHCCSRMPDSCPDQMARVNALFLWLIKLVGHERSDDCGPCQIKYGGFFMDSAARG